ncbi:MAG: hypothetical protein SFV22_09080 [Saprospiraceae bacterium]|nr:hypothetical protein [Saprospiraceae bacterium]
MARRYRSKSSGGKGQGAILLIATLVAVIIFIIKIILVLLPFLVVGFLGYKYYQWQKARLLVYDNNWNRFYHEELKFKLQLWGSIFAIIIGLIIAFVRPWAGFPISLAGVLTFPNVQQWLAQKLNDKYNNWTKWTAIASLLTISLAANGVYSDISAKRVAEQTKIEKAKADELERLRQEKQIKIDSATYFVQIASKNIKDKKYNNADENLRKATILDPENQNVAYYRGLIFQNRGKYNNALEEYNKVATVPDLQSGELQYQKGQCYLNLGKKEQALTEFQSSGSLGFEKGNNLYEKLKPKPKKSPSVSSKSTTSPSSYSSGGSSSRSGGCLAGQCIAYTKKGYRCSRRTTSCSGRCWQH